MFCFLIVAMLRKNKKHEFKFYKYYYFRNFVYTPVEYEGLFFFNEWFVKIYNYPTESQTCKTLYSEKPILTSW